MTAPNIWLPALVSLSAHGGDPARYIAAVYAVFEADFVLTKPRFRNGLVGLGWSPIDDGKPKTFWHMTSTGKVEADRMPDLRRCECIGWPKVLIGAAAGDQVRCWAKMHDKEQRWYVALPDFSYLVALAEGRRGDYVLITAFHVEHERQRSRLEAEWRAWTAAQKS